MAAAYRDVEAVTLARDGSPPITRTTFPKCRVYPVCAGMNWSSKEWSARAVAG